MDYISRIKNLTNKATHLYKLKKQNLILAKQETIAGIIFDAILKKEDPDKISNKIKQPISKEIKSILYAIKKIGYLPKLKPLILRPTISVVIPHFNQHKYLDEALHHLSIQSSIPEEVIVVDGESKHKSLVKKIFDKHKKKMNLKLLFPQGKLFAGDRRQIGAEASNSDIVTVHDADDISHVNRIELTKKFFQTHPNSYSLSFGCVRFKKKFLNFIKDFNSINIKNHLIEPNKISLSLRERFIKQEFSSDLQYQMRLGCYGNEGNYTWGCQAAHVAYRKEVTSFISWNPKKQLTFTRFEDYYFNVLLFLLGQQSYQLDLPIVYYRIGSSVYNTPAITNEINYAEKQSTINC